jgi:hypothetical protein
VAKAPEVAIKLEQVAPQAGEVAVLPVPVAPTTRKRSPAKVAEVDLSSRRLRDRFY